MPVAKYNQLQWDRYGDYVAGCIMTNVPYLSKDEMYPGIPVKYGYVKEGAGNIRYWKQFKFQFSKS